jgi:ubiquinone/menaquinone biosynthesis C-methylase UbiE
MKDLTEILSDIDAECVLEIGCGQGNFLKNLADSLPSTKMFVGVDIVDPRTTVPTELLGRSGFEWVEAWGHDLPFPDDSFDFVSLAHVLHHLAPDFVEATLAEAKRVLCPSGSLLIYEMYNDDQTEAQMSHVFYHHWLAEIDRVCGVHHYPTFAREQLIQMIDSLSLKNLRLDDYNEVYTPEQENEKISQMLSKMEARVEDVKDSPEYDRFKEEVQSINIWMMTHGLAAPTRLIAVGQI